MHVENRICNAIMFYSSFLQRISSPKLTPYACRLLPVAFHLMPDACRLMPDACRLMPDA
jgi:hypothetical protein